MADWGFLPFNLRWVKQLVWDTTGDDCEGASPVVFPEDADEKIDLIFSISLNEFTKLLSSVEKGATLSYPVDDWNVVWTFLRAFECPMQICEAIINCMMTDQDTRDSIINMLLNSPQFIDSIKDIAGGRQPINPGEIVKPIVEDCDKDVLFGAITRVVDGMNTNNIDAFEIMEEATNDEERAVLLIEAVPILAEFVPAELVDIAQQLVENMQENYDAEWTAALRDEIRMDLLCIAEKECKLTVGMIYDYFSNRIGGSLNIATGFLDAARFLAYGDFPGVQVVNFAMMFQAVALRGGSAFFGQTLYSVELQAALGANNPDNDWTLLDPADCPEDDVPCVEFSMDTALGDFYGQLVGKSVRKGDIITITATGSHVPASGYPSYDADGPANSADPNFLAPDANQFSLIAQIEGEGDRVWHEIGVEGSFTAPLSGPIRVNTNPYKGGYPMTSTIEYADNVGTFELEVCVEPIGIELQKTAEGFKLELISQNGGEPIYEVETVYTGHYLVFSAVEINGTIFYVKHVQVMNPSSPYFNDLNTNVSIGLGVLGASAGYKYNNIAADQQSTVLTMGQVGPGVKVRFTLTTEPGEEGELVPYTIGPTP